METNELQSFQIINQTTGAILGTYKTRCRPAIGETIVVVSYETSRRAYERRAYEVKAVVHDVKDGLTRRIQLQVTLVGRSKC